ncbi:hypothetical protein ACPOL_3953 [Acidisarcina polymorpha]|uniref:Uncharacterized protein n=1 Tax=Acidisarcina polymorpha TaxID=2211140 RepID=A0A2Z5G2A9_9BACT|nr:hypothetical protein ACPOL_3953 [Acidisarcina polymorpha]
MGFGSASADAYQNDFTKRELKVTLADSVYSPTAQSRSRNRLLKESMSF